MDAKKFMISSLMIPMIALAASQPIFTITNGMLIDVNLNGATEVSIPDSVMSICDYAFYGCSGLKSVTIPNSVESIGAGAFWNCANLEEVVIGKGVNELSTGSFATNRMLRIVRFLGPPITYFLMYPALPWDGWPDSAIRIGGGVPVFDCTPNAIGYYSQEYAAEWREVIDADGKWQGLTMRESGNGGGTVGSPDIQPYTPSDWSAPLVISASGDSTEGATRFFTDETLYVNWAFVCRDSSISEKLYFYCYVDDNPVHGWSSEGLQKDYYTCVKGYSIGRLGAGTHTIRVVADATGVVVESSETNNVYETSITVISEAVPNLSVTAATVSRTSIALSDSVAVHWRVVNNGKSAAPKSKIAFMTYDYDATTEATTLSTVEWLDCPPLAAGGRRDFKKTINGSKLGIGTHSFIIATDGNNTIVERDETDNLCSAGVVVTKDIATKSTSGVDWQFKTMKGELDAFYLSTSAKNKKKATTFKVGQPIYMRCCWWNAKKGALSGTNMRIEVLLNGGSGVYSDRSDFAKNTYYSLTDRTPDFLQNLPAGKYTLTAILDSNDNWWESNEKNNIRTIAFTVVGKPMIYSEASYRCALRESVSWPVTSEGNVFVKGLPPGLKFSGGTIVGKPTKLGTYKVKITSTNAAGKVTKTIKITVYNPGFGVTFTARTNGAGADGAQNVSSGATVPMTVGVKQRFTVASTPGKTGVAKSAASSVKASGLPPGLKYSKGVISGVPTKTGTYKIKLVIKNSIGWSKTFTVKMSVKSLPTWAKGTFKGKLYYTVTTDESLADSVLKGSVTLTVGKTGKVSGKFVNMKKKSYSFAVNHFNSFVDDILRTSATMKYGTKSVVVEIAVAQDDDTLEGFAEVGSITAPFSGDVAELTK